MTLHPEVIDAASYAGSKSRQARASGVLLAQAEHVSDGAVDAALDAWYPGENWRAIYKDSPIELAKIRDEMRAAIAAALRHEAGE